MVCRLAYLLIAQEFVNWLADQIEPAACSYKFYWNMAMPTNLYLSIAAVAELSSCKRDHIAHEG